MISSSNVCTRKKSEIISICNDISTLQQTFKTLKKIVKTKPLDVDKFKINLISYAEQYVSGVNRQQFFSVFCEHAIIKFLLDLVKRNNDPNIFITVMKALNIISFNLRQQKQIGFFLSNSSLSDFFEIKVNRSKTTQAAQVYVQFLKSLILRLGQHEYYKLFFNHKKSLFPLMWKIFSFYNHREPLTRATVKLVILKIFQINDISIKAYLNNFPGLMFEGLFSRHTIYLIDECIQKPQKDQQKQTISFDTLIDQINFIDEVLIKSEQPTKLSIFNSLIYYPLRHLWNSISSSSTSVSSILTCILIMLFNMNRDKELLKLLSNLFLESQFSESIFRFMKQDPKQLKLYQKQTQQQYENCRQILQKHCSKIYNQMQNTHQNKIIHKQNHSSNFVDKSLSVSKQIFNNIIGTYSWQGFIKTEIQTLSQVTGNTLQLYQPISYNKSSIFLQFQNDLNKNKMRKNPFSLKLLDRLKLDKKALNNYLKFIKSILKNPLLQSIQNIFISSFMNNFVIILTILKDKKTIESIMNFLQIVQIVKQKISNQQLISLVSNFKDKVNNLSKQSSDQLLQTQFTEWQNYLDIFADQQKFMNQLLKQKTQITQVSYNLQDTEILMGRQQLTIHYYFMLRHVVSIIKGQNTIQCQQVIEHKYSNQQKKQNLKRIFFTLNSNKCYSCVKGRLLRICKQGGSIVYQGYLKRLNMRDIKQQTIQIFIPPSKAIIQFSSMQNKHQWIDAICSMSKDIQKIQIEVIEDLVQNILLL